MKLTLFRPNRVRLARGYPQFSAVPAVRHGSPSSLPFIKKGESKNYHFSTCVAFRDEREHSSLNGAGTG